MKVDKELTKGSHELIILKLLSRQDMYGYQLIQQMSLLSDDVFCMSQGSLYPFLHALEDKGYIQSYPQLENGRERRFYHLTQSGHKALEDKERQWDLYTRAMARILGGIAKAGPKNSGRSLPPIFCPIQRNNSPKQEHPVNFILPA